MERYDAALKIVASAQEARDKNKKKEAHALFVQGIEQLLKLAQNEPSAERAALIRKHAAKFMSEAETLVGGTSASVTTTPRPAPKLAPSENLRRAIRLEKQATDFQKNLAFQKACKAFTEAAEAYQAHRKEVEHTDKEAHQTSGEKALLMVERAEKMQSLYQNPLLGGSGQAATSTDALLNLPAPPDSTATSTSTSMAKKTNNVPQQLADTQGGLANNLANAFVGNHQRSEEEAKVLRVGAKINGRIYEPLYACNTDISNFTGDDFKDPDGHPRLSPKQKAAGAVWGRPQQFLKKPVVIKEFTFHSIRQTLVGDCSFVSSLAVCAGWEHRFKKTLISRNIFPQDTHHNPIISPSGKYIVKMFLNGCVRGIVIDDYFPVTPSDRQMLCTYSKHADELWVSLFEKAYMKLHAGYDFPGSTSSTDLHALCGWIPETFHLDKDKAKTTPQGSAALPIEDPETCWKRMILAHNKGTALFTMGTKDLAQAEEERTGLAGQHAYAVLDVVEKCGRKLVKLKNPWANLRWKGEFSPGDTKNWTEELRAALDYDREAEKVLVEFPPCGLVVGFDLTRRQWWTVSLRQDNVEVDDGIFWISWEAVQAFFGSVHGSWSPARFTNRKVVHGYYNKIGSDKRHMDGNPQYVLRMRTTRETMVWLLVSRHYQDTKIEPFFALHVYKGSRKVFNTEEAVIRGVYGNSPHNLLRLPIPKGDSSFVLVVSLYDDRGALPFTLTAYSVDPLVLSKALDCPAIENTQQGEGHKQTFLGRWDVATAGGSINTDQFDMNPQFKLQVTGAGPQLVFVKVSVKDDSTHALGIHLFPGGNRIYRQTNVSSEIKANAPDNTAYRSGFGWREFVVGAGTYTLVACTYDAGETGEFQVTVRAKNPIFATNIPFQKPPPGPPRPPTANSQPRPPAPNNTTQPVPTPPAPSPAQPPAPPVPQPTPPAPAPPVQPAAAGSLAALLAGPVPPAPPPPPMQSAPRDPIQPPKGPPQSESASDAIPLALPVIAPPPPPPKYTDKPGMIISPPDSPPPEAASAPPQPPPPFPSHFPPHFDTK